MPFNELLVEQFYIDPQGDDIYAFYYSKLAWRHTSGFVAGTLAALVFGVVLGVRIGRPGIGRLSSAGAVAWAAAGGAVLAMVNAGVAFLAGGPKHLSVVWAGDLYEVDLFQADGPWRVVVVWAALFPVAAVAGAALSPWRPAAPDASRRAALHAGGDGDAGDSAAARRSARGEYHLDGRCPRSPQSLYVCRPLGAGSWPRRDPSVPDR
jgi:hypothetical protein